MAWAKILYLIKFSSVQVSSAKNAAIRVSELSKRNIFSSYYGKKSVKMKSEKKDGPSHEKLEKIKSLVISRGSDDPAHLRSLTRAFADRTHKVWT